MCLHLVNWNDNRVTWLDGGSFQSTDKLCLSSITADSEQADIARMLYKDTCHEVLTIHT